jgi:uncharacterized membrane protein HdeD (DUF308 family)
VTVYKSTSDIETSPPSFGVCALLGFVLIAAGIVALSDVVFATTISVKLIGITVIAAGVFEGFHAFWTKGWGGFVWQIMLGAIYLAFGLVLLSEPDSAAPILVYLLGALLLASGMIRSILSFAYWRQNGWMMLVSGVFGILAGAWLLFGNNTISAWGIGFLLGIVLLSHGLAWLLYAIRSMRA